uniref:Uncharacterized protein n=1 Tax=Arundo donax TaxID=35708 RepID=A0A0A9HST9_ARUDO
MQLLRDNLTLWTSDISVTSVSHTQNSARTLHLYPEIILIPEQLYSLCLSSGGPCGGDQGGGTKVW